MQGKPPPSQAATGPQSSPSGTRPQPSQGPPPAVPSGALMGMAPPPGADSKPRGRGGAGVQLSDVGWGKIFKLGWKLLGFFKFLALAYCLMMLVQNCVNLGMSQLIGEVTKALNSSANAGPEDREAPANAPATTPANPNVTATSPGNAPALPGGPPTSRLLLVSVLW